MPRYKLEVMLSEELLARLDGARGFEPRASFARRALEAALGSQQGGKAREAEEPSVVKRGTSASPRASEPEKPYELPKIAKRKW